MNIFLVKILDEKFIVKNFGSFIMQEVSNKEISDLKNIIQTQKIEIDRLNTELNKRDKIIKSFPQLSQTSLGHSTSDGKIIYRNWWSAFISESEGFCDVIWFSRFLRHKFPDADYKLNFFSVFGEHDNISKPMDGKKVFFSGENLKRRFLNFTSEFGSYALDYVDLAMGFDLIDHPKYFRFPLWILFNFEPQLSEEDIENRINSWNSLNIEKTKDVAVIASHDLWKTRGLIVNDIENFVNIDFAGKWRNNTTDLWDKFDNNKNEYLKQFKFNLCPENLLDTAYVTEKIFDSIKTNCIPLYAGGGDYLEPEVLNNKAIIRWDFDKDNSDSIELFKNLILDKKEYDDFRQQNILLDSSPKYVIRKFDELEKFLEKLIYE